MYSTIYRYGLLAVVSSSFLVALIGYIKAYEEDKKTLFLLVNGAGGVWALSLFIFHTSSEPHLFWLRFSHLAGIFIPVTFVHFVFILLGELPRRRKQLVIFYLVGLALGLLSFTRLSIIDVTYKDVMGYHLVPGPAYNIFSFMFFFLITYGFFLMGKGLRKSSGFRRSQIQYCLAASILGLGGGISTFLPIYGINLPPLGILVVPSYGIILAYAILKRRLMDIRTIVSKGLLYSTVTLVVFGVLLFVVFTLTTRYRPGATPTHLFLYIAACCILLVLVLIPLRGRLERLIEKLIYRKALASYHQLTEASQRLLTILDKKTLSKFFLETVVQATETNWGTLWLAEEENDTYYLAGKKQTTKNVLWPSEGIFLNRNSDFVDLITRERRVLLREEILSFIENMNKGSLADELRKTDFSLVLPMFFEDHLKGCLFIGEKRSRDPFSSYELQALTLFSDQAAMALVNAQLFQRVRRLKEYNERIVDDVDSGLVVVNGEGQVTTFNRKMEQMTGLAANEILGKPISVLPSSLGEIIIRCRESRKPVSVPQLTVKTQQNKVLVISLNTSLIDTGNRRNEVVAILTDLTEVRRLEEKIRQTEKMASIGSMVSQLAHEIKNPLSSIRTFTELLPEKFDEGEFRKTFFSVVSKEIQRIDSLISRMLSLGRPSGRQYELAPIQEIINETLSSLEIQLRDKKLKTEFAYHQPVSFVWADPQSLKEVFSNILLNCIQAMDKGGKIQIRTNEKMDTNTGKPMLEISITDEGGGIPKSHLARVFDPFFTTKPRGSGLGLYICYKIIQAHKGEMRVTNTDSGAQLTILLPPAEKKNSFINKKGTIDVQRTSYQP